MLKIFETSDVERPGLWARFVHWVEGRPSAKMAAENESLKWKVADLESRLELANRRAEDSAQAADRWSRAVDEKSCSVAELKGQCEGLRMENGLITARLELAQQQLRSAKVRMDRIKELSGFFDDQWNFSDIEEAS